MTKIPTLLEETVDLHGPLAVGTLDEEAVVVAAGGTVALKAGTRVGVGEDVLNDATDLLTASFAHPVSVLLGRKFGDFRFGSLNTRLHVIRGATVAGDSHSAESGGTKSDAYLGRDTHRRLSFS